MGPFWCHTDGGIGGSMWGSPPPFLPAPLPAPLPSPQPTRASLDVILHHGVGCGVPHPTAVTLPFPPIGAADVDAAAQAVGGSAADRRALGGHQKSPHSVHQPFDLRRRRGEPRHQTQQLHRLGLARGAGGGVEDLHLRGYRRYGWYMADCMGGEREKGVVRGVLEDLLPHRTRLGVQEEAWRTCTSGATRSGESTRQTVWGERERQRGC